MPWYSCPHSEGSEPPTDVALRAVLAACACQTEGGCVGQLRLEVTTDDPSPAGIGLSPGHYTYADVVDSRDHTCNLTQAEMDAFCSANAVAASEPDEDDFL